LITLRSVSIVITTLSAISARANSAGLLRQNGRISADPDHFAQFLDHLDHPVCNRLGLKVHAVKEPRCLAIARPLQRTRLAKRADAYCNSGSEMDKSVFVNAPLLDRDKLNGLCDLFNTSAEHLERARPLVLSGLERSICQRRRVQFLPRLKQACLSIVDRGRRPAVNISGRHVKSHVS